MRKARRGDVARSLDRKEPNPCVADFAFEGVPILGTASIAEFGCITVICGANGSGKSGILETLFEALAGNPHPDVPEYRRPIRSSGSLSVRVDVRFEKASVGLPLPDALDTDELQSQASVLLYNPASMSELHAECICDDAQCEELVDQAGVSTYTDEERKEISQLLGRNYDNVGVSEIEIDDMAVPFFFVEHAGIKYDTRSMGVGERSLQTLYWLVRRASVGTILLLEEVEAHVSMKSQEMLIAWLAQRSVSQKIAVVLTTHSRAVVEFVPRRHVYLASRGRSGVSLKGCPTDNELRESVGLDLRNAIMVYTEDRCSRFMLASIIRHVAPLLLHRVIIRSCDGDGDVKKLVEFLPNHVDSRFEIWGCLDGCERVINEEDRVHRHAECRCVKCERNERTIISLPGRSAPEQMLQVNAHKEASQLASLLGKDEESVAAALVAAEGDDHHDWLEELRSGLDLPYESLVDALTQVWLLNDEQSKKEADHICKLLAASLRLI